MKILILCGVIGKENQSEAIAHSRGGADLAANLFQQKLIGGFRSLYEDCTVLSAPFLGAWPKGSDLMRFRGFSKPEPEIEYVKFNNIWGLRNFSRASVLKKALKSFVELQDPEKLILIYCPHTPFLEAAVWAKKQDPSIRLCLYVPDLPAFMNLNTDRTRIYDIAKKYDIARMNGLMEQVDAFVLLTDYMKDKLPIGSKPFTVVEGIVERVPAFPEYHPGEGEEKYIVYTGKINEKFGVKALVDAFRTLSDPTYRLVLCGKGDCESYARSVAEQDSRVMVMGQLTPEQAMQWQSRAAVLINPRGGTEEYTRYSFPSKNIEYLLSGKPVVGYYLDGMPPVYREYLHCIDQALPEEQAIARSLDRVLKADAEQMREKNRRFFDYAESHLKAENIAKAITELITH